MTERARAARERLEVMVGCREYAATIAAADDHPMDAEMNYQRSLAAYRKALAHLLRVTREEAGK